MDEQDQETTVVLHIESALGYENAEEVISVPGVDMVYAGPGDSSIELGHPGDYNHPDVRGPMEKVLELCKKYGVAFGTTPADGKGAGEWAKKGATFFEAASEIEFIRAGAAALLAEYKKHTTQ